MCEIDNDAHTLEKWNLYLLQFCIALVWRITLQNWKYLIFMKNKYDSLFDKKQFFIIIKCNSKEHSLVQLKKKTTKIKALRISTTFVEVTEQLEIWKQCDSKLRNSLLRHFQTNFYCRIRRGKGETDLLQLTIRIKYHRISRKHLKSCKGINRFYFQNNLYKKYRYILSLIYIGYMHSIIPNKVD